jgi:hypothetical protein
MLLGVLRLWFCWRLYKRPSFSLLLLTFLESFVRESFLHSQNGFLDAHGGYYMVTIYIHYIFFSFLKFNSRKTALCHLMLKVTFFSWLWVSWVSFACWFLVFLSCCYFFFFFYFCIIATIGTTTTITSSSVSEGEGTLETNYKLWMSEFQSCRRRKERVAPKLVLLPTREHTHTHTHTRFDCSTRYEPGDATPHTFVFLVHRFGG